MNSNLKEKKLAVIGGGAAGFFTTANLAEDCSNLKISIFESGRNFLTKVGISGGGRCNVTHNCFDKIKFSEAYPRGKHELIGPFSHFSAYETIEWFAQRGVELIAESDGRMFPSTNRSETIIECLNKSVNFNNVSLNLELGVKSVIRQGHQFILELTDGRTEKVDYLLLATGSSKSGYKIASSLGHSITECSPSLFTFKSSDIRFKELAGTSFQDVHLQLKTSEKKVFKQQGSLLITHWGLSGPTVLKLSSFAARELAKCNYQAILYINWIAGISEDSAREKLGNLRKSLAAKEIGANPQFLLTRRFWEALLTFSGIPLNLHFFELSNQQLLKLCTVLTKSEVEINGKGEFKEEFVTCGGINLKEINFHCFESKIVPNLFFAGEILDIDGITGGFNFQAAWTGGWLVAKTIKERLQPTIPKQATE